VTDLGQGLGDCFMGIAKDCELGGATGMAASLRPFPAFTDALKRSAT
jgi:hypothetical protein